MKWLVLSVLGASVCLGAPPAPVLQINRLVLQQFEDGTPILKPDTVTPGETIRFSFNIQGFTRKEDHVVVSYSARPLDPAGTPLAPPVTGKIDTTLTSHDKDWQPKMRGAFVLPELLFAGEYKIQIEAKDEIGGTSASQELPFLVAGPAAPASRSLEVSSLSFYANDDAEKPLPVAAYRSGEEIHSRFIITGFGHKDNGGINVAYGIKLTNSAGNVLFEDKDAAIDKSTEFYPKPYIPAQMAFTLKPGTAMGEYTMEVTARDLVGNQQASAKSSFKLE